MRWIIGHEGKVDAITLIARAAMGDVMQCDGGDEVPDDTNTHTFMLMTMVMMS